MIQCYDSVSLPCFSFLSLSFFSFTASLLSFCASFLLLLSHSLPYLPSFPSFLLFPSQHYTSNVTHRALINLPGGFRKILHISSLKNSRSYRQTIKTMAVKDNCHPKKILQGLCVYLYATQISLLTRTICFYQLLLCRYY